MICHPSIRVFSLSSATALLLILLLLLVAEQTAGAIQMASSNAIYTFYYNYSIKPTLVNTTRTIPGATIRLCAFLCTSIPGCYAVTFNLVTNVCSTMSPYCGHAVLTQTSGTVTAVTSNFTLAAASASLIMPVVNTCGGYNASFSNLTSTTVINYDPSKATTGYERYTLWSSVAPLAFYFPYVTSSSPYSNTTNIVFTDSSYSSLNLFSAGSSFSIAFMIYPSNSGSNSFTILSFSRLDSSCCVYFNYYYSNSAYYISFSYRPNCASSQTQPSVQIITPATDLWYHYAVVYNSVAQTLVIYLNGNVVSFTSITLTPISDPQYTLMIGNSMSSVTGNTFVGQIYCLQLYKTALSAQNINANYQMCRFGGIFMQ